jgi:low affinity Fe/Cu permease
MGRYLVLAPAGVGDESLLEELGRLAAGEQSHFHVLVPCRPGGETDPGLAARRRLATLLDALAVRGLDGDGEVGEGSVIGSVARATERTHYDALVVPLPGIGVVDTLDLEVARRLHQIDVPVLDLVTPHPRTAPSRSRRTCVLSANRLSGWLQLMHDHNTQRVLMPSEVSGEVGVFDRFAGWAAQVASRASFFTFCVLLIVFWAPTYFVLRNGDMWQLIINTATTIITFLMVALLQNSQTRSDQAVQHKLNALAEGLADVMAHLADPEDATDLRQDIVELRDAVGLETHESTTHKKAAAEHTRNVSAPL